MLQPTSGLLRVLLLLLRGCVSADSVLVCCPQASRVVPSSTPGKLALPSPQGSSHTAKPCCHPMLTKQQVPAQQEESGKHRLQ